MGLLKFQGTNHINDREEKDKNIKEKENLKMLCARERCVVGFTLLLHEVLSF